MMVWLMKVLWHANIPDGALACKYMRAWLTCVSRAGAEPAPNRIDPVAGRVFAQVLGPLHMCRPGVHWGEVHGTGGGGGVHQTPLWAESSPRSLVFST